MLANAVHFKSGWMYEFSDAVDEPFYLTPSKTKTVKMMTLKHDLQYYHDDELKFSAIELQYEVINIYKFIFNILKLAVFINFAFRTMPLK